MLAVLISLPMRSCSTGTSLASSAASPLAVVTPTPRSFSTTSGLFSATCKAPLSLTTTSLGVLAGANMPYQAVNCHCGKPASAKVGTFGRSGERCGRPIAMARILPPLIWPIAAVVVSKMTCRRPPMRSSEWALPPL